MGAPTAENCTPHLLIIAILRGQAQYVCVSKHKSRGFRRELFKEIKQSIVLAVRDSFHLIEEVIHRFIQLVDDVVEETIAKTYFIYWDFKREIKQKVKFASFTILIVSASLPILEMLLDLAGEKWVAAGIEATGQAFLWRALFISAVMLVLLHNFDERRKPRNEYEFVQLLRRVMHHVHRPGGIVTLPAKNMLEICCAAFAHSGISHACISSLEGDELVIREGHIFPEDPWLHEYRQLRLKNKQGIAGLVWNDNKIRYVPRLFWPTSTKVIKFPICTWGGTFKMWSFPHAVTFDFDDTDELALITANPEYGCVDMHHPFGKNGGGDLPFRAFLCVPLNTRTARFGVLNIDFGRVDPLGKPEIEMALTFASAIAEELEAGHQLKGTSFAPPDERDTATGQ